MSRQLLIGFSLDESGTCHVLRGYKGEPNEPPVVWNLYTPCGVDASNHRCKSTAERVVTCMACLALG